MEADSLLWPPERRRRRRKCLVDFVKKDDKLAENFVFTKLNFYPPLNVFSSKY